ncbi:MAG: hypothetical protein WAU81_01760 [Candidatus Aminicenantales bacterium]
MKQSRDDDLLSFLIRSADEKTLRRLILHLSNADILIRRRCLDFLLRSLRLPDDEASAAEAESALALWEELEGDLAELDEYGGADDETTDHVSSLLYELAKKLSKKKIPRQGRRKILENVLAYIQSGNAGLDDDLYEVAYASCHDDEDRRHLAGRFEALGQDWPLEHARRIYRDLKDREKYLELRLRKMIYGGDYHDLATFYWEQGEREKALEVGRGLRHKSGVNHAARDSQ